MLTTTIFSTILHEALSDGLLWFQRIEFKVTVQLIGFTLVGVTTNAS